MQRAATTDRSSSSLDEPSSSNRIGEKSMFEEINPHRRRFFGTVATAFAAAQLGLIGFANAQSGTAKPLPAIKPGTNTSLGGLKQIDAGVLNIGYAEAGAPDGSPVILLHGWPYDIHSYVDVAPLLASAVYRVIVPYLRGYGTTRFLSGDTFRNGQQSIMALDIIALMDALKIQKAVLAGFDWGARTADIMAVFWPERCKALISVSGYLIGSVKANQQPLPPQAELAWWFQFYFSPGRGLLGDYQTRRDFTKLIWQTASPKWHFDDETFERSAEAFNNSDHVAIVITLWNSGDWSSSAIDGFPDRRKLIVMGQAKRPTCPHC